MTLQQGAQAPSLQLTSIAGTAVPIPDPASRWVHLQFRRYAGCPICNLHLQQLKRRAAELTAAGIREVAVFHSPLEEMLTYKAGFPFDLIADPEKRLYRQFQVEPSLCALLSLKAWVAIIRGELAMEKRTLSSPGGRFGVPADFLIDAQGRIAACKYGRHADDQWTVDELLAAAGQK